MGASKQRLEFGDYQTPLGLARTCCRILSQLGISPRSMVEPTCGMGAFLKAGIDIFETLEVAKGFEIQRRYLDQAKLSIGDVTTSVAKSVEHADFFDVDWSATLNALPEPILLLGNPPWVTNAALESAGSSNLPPKSNFQGLRGLDAVTGKGNFDISEYMLIRLGEVLEGRNATLAMLCKTTVARKALHYFWKRNRAIRECRIFPIDAMREFGAAVEACLFVARFDAGEPEQSCLILDSLSSTAAIAERLGYRDGRLVSDVAAYERGRFLRGPSGYVWRSGLKHDCAKVMEFTVENNSLINGLGEAASLEDTYVYPLLKSSGIAGSKRTKRRVLVTQKTTGENTSAIAEVAPRTWSYLLAHAESLDRRASVIYRKRPRFSIFGIGPYAFSKWKVVISGLYKRLEFKVAGPENGRPVMVDDTAYFLGFESEAEARFCADLLNSEMARSFLSSLIFWDAKRPITAEILNQLSIEELARRLTREAELLTLAGQGGLRQQRNLFNATAQ